MTINRLTFNGSDRPEAIRQSNTAMRGFLAAGKVEAAKQVLGMLPYDTDEIAESEIGKRSAICFTAVFVHSFFWRARVACSVGQRTCS